MPSASIRVYLRFVSCCRRRLKSGRQSSRSPSANLRPKPCCAVLLSRVVASRRAKARFGRVLGGRQGVVRVFECGDEEAKDCGCRRREEAVPAPALRDPGMVVVGWSGVRA